MRRIAARRFVFHPQHVESRRMGNFFLDLLGFERQTVDSGWSAEVVLLMQDGRSPTS